ncbi:hypothetical protein GCM10010195_67090 [Kitasatospora griseola]|nr:hypothetical protein GCM10010195_67090 [Kitasatospora griseola]
MKIQEFVFGRAMRFLQHKALCPRPVRGGRDDAGPAYLTPRPAGGRDAGRRDVTGRWPEADCLCR